MSRLQRLCSILTRHFQDNKQHFLSLNQIVILPLKMLVLNHSLNLRLSCSVSRLGQFLTGSASYWRNGRLDQVNRSGPRRGTLRPKTCSKTYADSRLLRACCCRRVLPLLATGPKPAKAFSLMPAYDRQRIPLLGASRRHAARPTARLPLPGLAQQPAATRRNATRSWLLGGGT